LAQKSTLALNRVRSAATKRFISLRKSVNASENDAEVTSGVQMHAISESSSFEESESKPEAILVFADAIQRQPEDHARSSFSQAINSPKSDTRGAAALQIFLLTYITPVEVCLNMLTCYRLDEL
jgi:hypothetical protein